MNTTKKELSNLVQSFERDAFTHINHRSSFINIDEYTLTSRVRRLLELNTFLNIYPVELSSFEGMWIDFNVKANTVTLFLNNKPFNSHFTWETITLFPENILKTEISYLFNGERGKKEGLAKFILKRQCQLCYATDKHELLNCRLLALHSLDTEKFREIFNQVFPKIHKVKPKQSGVRVLHCKKVYKPLDIVSVRSSTTNPSTTFNVTMDSSVADKERQSNVGRKLANVATSSINSTSSNTRSISSKKSMDKTSLNQSIQAGGLDKVDARHITLRIRPKAEKKNLPRLQKITDFSLIGPVRTYQPSDSSILKLERTKNSILENPIVEDLPEPHLIQFSQPEHQELYHTETESFETAKTNLDSEEEAEIHSNGIKFESFQDISQENEYVEGGSKENSQEANFDLNKEYKSSSQQVQYSETQKSDSPTPTKITFRKKKRKMVDENEKLNEPSQNSIKNNSAIISSNFQIKSPIFKSQLSKEKDQKDQVGDQVEYSETQKSDSPTPDKKIIDEDRSSQSLKSNNKMSNEESKKTSGRGEVSVVKIKRNLFPYQKKKVIKYKWSNKIGIRTILSSDSKSDSDEEDIVRKYNLRPRFGKRHLDKKIIDEDRSSQSLKSNNKMSNEESKKTRGRDEVSVVQTKRKLLPDQKKPSKVRKLKMSNKIGMNERTIPSSDSNIDSDEEDEIPLSQYLRKNKVAENKKPGGAAGSDDRNVMIENQMQQDDTVGFS